MKEKELRISISEDIFNDFIRKYNLSNPVIQKDSYYDFEDYRLLNSKHDLRIREEDENFKKAELKCLFYLGKKQKWYLEKQLINLSINKYSLSNLFTRLSIPFSEEDLSIIQNKDTFCMILEKNGVSKKIEIVKKRYKYEFDGGIILLDDVIEFGYFIKIKTVEKDPLISFKEIYPDFSEENIVRFGYTEYFMDKLPEIFYSTQTRKKLFLDNCKWNVLENEDSFYETINHSKNVWINIHFKNYDLYVAYYIDNLFANIENVDKCYFIYWDNLIYPDTGYDTHGDDINIKKLKNKLDLISPKKFFIYKFSEIKNLILTETDNKISKEINSAVENIRYYLDSDFLKRIIDSSKPSLNIQVINNMIEDFVLCCFAEKLLGYKMDIYYTGSRFVPLESLFRKFLYKYSEMHFPELQYVYFPPYFDDFAKSIEGGASNLLIERTISSFLYLYPEKSNDIFTFYGVDSRLDLTKIIISKFAEINE